ncbi:MAG: glycerol-3-phosphate 1-O-acyltransferase PlsY [Eubacteriales bacterium]
MERILCMVIGYVFGLFQTSYIYGKMHGIDIRKQGSGNAGTTNTLRVLGAKAGVIVLIGDIIKTVLAISVTRILFGSSQSEAIYLLSLYTAAGAILGHNFPFYLNFKGGKGIAATVGLVLAFHPTFIPVLVIVFFGILFTTHYVSLGSLMIYVCFMIQLIISGQCGLFGEIPQGVLNEMYIVGFCLAAMAFWKHKENIGRLLSGTERKTYLTKKNDVK